MSEQYLTIKQAASILGVSTLTLRNWDKNGKLKAFRHPMNNYRVYETEDIKKVMEEIKTGVGLRKKAQKEFKKIIIQHLTD